MQKITPFLWFENQAEDAAKYYTAIFKNSKITDSNPMTVNFELEGQPFIALNGGPEFKFNESVSFFVSCKDQGEVDYFWEKLLEGGTQSQCGWLKDKYGLSWQIVPEDLGKYIGGPDAKKAAAAMQTMLKMHKLEISKLKEAYDNG
jgi:predicted 3-demethylubiquinone-9 3-methyltransferase (glyoxalase superfamily)